MTDIKIFNSEEFGTIRTIDKNGEPWFVGKDVANALGYANSKDALISHVDNDDREIFQRSGSTTFDIPNRGITIINESGLYSLIFSSKLPKAKEFKHWVTSEVLPSIRKTGSYGIQDYPPKSTSAGEIASLIKRLDDIAKAKRCSGDERATIANAICQKFGILLPECFTKQSPWEQTTLFCIVH